MITQTKDIKRKKRHRRIRKKVFGTSKRPRLSIFRSNSNLYVQCIDDIKNKVIFGLSTLNLEFKKQHKYGGNKKAAEDLGKMFVEITKKKKIKECVFDRSGYLYQGRIKAFVESARDAGLKI